MKAKIQSVGGGGVLLVAYTQSAHERCNVGTGPSRLSVSVSLLPRPVCVVVHAQGCIRGGRGGGGFGWYPPPPMVPAEAAPKFLKLKSSWHRRHRSKMLAVRLKRWKGRRGGGGKGGVPSPPPTVYGRSNTSLHTPVEFTDTGRMHPLSGGESGDLVHALVTQGITAHPPPFPVCTPGKRCAIVTPRTNSQVGVPTGLPIDGALRRKALPSPHGALETKWGGSRRGVRMVQRPQGAISGPCQKWCLAGQVGPQKGPLSNASAPPPPPLLRSAPVRAHTHRREGP